MANKNKKGGKKAESPLRKALAKGSAKASPKSSQSSAGASNGTPTRQENSLFLTYLKCAMKSKDATTMSQAQQLNKHYSTLSVTEKKGIISSFFKEGGKRAGLQSVFGQYVQCESHATDGTWSGYCNVKMLLKFKEVMWRGIEYNFHCLRRAHYLAWSVS